MRIDVHTTFSRQDCCPSLEGMTETFGTGPVGINTVDGIKSHMKASGVDKSVYLV
ncbi:MAG: hypothetical protein CM1200mP22_25030 [Dehalococcoidia bacterium]|nr:MAG: hypothetical protein CM1200mP22_25030 [Dehalococcoidia bacterium]